MRFIAFTLALFLATPAFAQDTSHDEAYLALVDTAQRDTVAAPWCKVRDVYYNTSFYAAHRGEVKKAAASVAKRLMSEKSSEAVAAFEQFMRENAGSPVPHLYAIDMYNWNKEVIKRKQEPVLPDLGKGIHYIRVLDEEAIAKSLVACAAKSSDGRSMDTAYRVVDHDEAAAVVQQLSGLPVDGTESMEASGRKYEMLTVQIPDGPKQKVWFLFQTPRAP